MSILSALINGKITFGEAVTEAEQWLANIGQQVAADPVVQAAVNTLGADAKAALNIAEEWTGTALEGALGVLAADVEAAIQKYAGSVSGGSAIGAAAVTAIQAGAAVGKAAIESGVTAFKNANG